MFDYKSFMPHGHCFLWKPSILWMWVISHGLIALAYYSIPVALFYYVRKRQDTQFKSIFILFGLFILFCGTTHLISIYTLWVPNYGLEVSFAIATAIISAVTAVILWPMIPIALKIPSLKEFTEKNNELQILNQDLELRVEKRVQDSKLLASIVEHSKDAIVSKSLDGKILTWNRAAQKIFQYTQNEIVGKSIFTLIPDYLVEKENEILSLMKSGVEVGPIDTVRLRKDGQKVSVHLSLSSIRDEQGKIVGISSIASDISSKILLDEKLNQTARALQKSNQDLVKVNQAKDEFIANLAHELRTPLNIVSGFTEMLAIYKQESTEYSSALEAIKRAVSTQIHLVEDLLDMSRVISGKFSLVTAANKVSEIVNNSIKAVEFSARTKEIDLVTTIDSKITLLLCDSDRLQQVLWNLLSNAVKFTGKGGRVDLNVIQEDEYIVFEVTDTGVGISAIDLPHVFDRLWQSESFDSNRRGLGLGLKIVKDLVEAHGGSISVFSDGVNAGSTFKAKFPIVAATKKDLSTTSGLSDAPLRGMCILVVDDCEDAVFLIKSILERAGAIIVTAFDGAEALELIRKNNIEFIVSDINMPIMDGHSFIEQTRIVEKNKNRKTHRPAIALTARSGPGEKELAHKSGFQLHMIKPVQPDILVAKILEMSSVDLQK